MTVIFCWTTLLVTLIFIIAQIRTCFCISLRDELLLTDEQREGFERFKAKALPLITTKYMKQDIVLIKYYRACNMDENKAIDKMRSNLKWRLDMGFEDLTEDELNEYSRNYPYLMLEDKFGRGVFFKMGKYWDISAAASTPELTRKLSQYMFHGVEEAYEKGVSNLTGKTASGMIHVEDLYGIDMSRAFCVSCGTLTKDVLAQVDTRWPGGLQMMIFVNSQPLLEQALGVLKMDLPKSIQVYIFDEDDKVWMPEVLKVLRKDQIPSEMYIRSEMGAQGGGGGGDGGGGGNPVAAGAVGGAAMMGSFFGGGGPPAPGMNGGGMGAGGKKKMDGRGMKNMKSKKQKKRKKKQEEEDDDDEEEE